DSDLAIFGDRQRGARRGGVLGQRRAASTAEIIGRQVPSAAGRTVDRRGRTTLAAKSVPARDALPTAQAFHGSLLHARSWRQPRLNASARQSSVSRMATRQFRGDRNGRGDAARRAGKTGGPAADRITRRRGSHSFEMPGEVRPWRGVRVDTPAAPRSRPAAAARSPAFSTNYRR